MPATSILSREDTSLRDHIDSMMQALRAKDIDALMQHYAPDVITFDLQPPQEIHGNEAYRKNFERWFGSVEGPIDYQAHDLHIVTHGDVAFCHSLSHVRSIRTTGDKADYWVRVTSGVEKRNGRWLITHEHISAPIDMMSKQAVLELQR